MLRGISNRLGIFARRSSHHFSSIEKEVRQIPKSLISVAGSLRDSVFRAIIISLNTLSHEPD